jgi:hypothetical protein
VALALAGCGGSTLPSFGEPQGSVLGEADLEGGDLIGYRQLTRDDFRGAAPRDRRHVDRVGAETFAIVKHDPGLRVSTRRANEKAPIVGKLENLRFRAWMDRSRSWWNPKPGSLPAPYILEHEQIHFALVELEARAMSAEGRELMSRSFEAKDQKTLQADIDEAIGEIMEEGMERLLETNRDFDEDTSGRYEPGEQKIWLRRVESALAAQK